MDETSYRGEKESLRPGVLGRAMVFSSRWPQGGTISFDPRGRVPGRRLHGDVSRWDDQAAGEVPYAGLGYTASASAEQADRTATLRCQCQAAIRDGNRRPENGQGIKLAPGSKVRGRGTELFWKVEYRLRVPGVIVFTAHSMYMYNPSTLQRPKIVQLMKGKTREMFLQGERPENSSSRRKRGRKGYMYGMQVWTARNRYHIALFLPENLHNTIQ